MGEILQFPVIQAEEVYALPLAAGSGFIIGQALQLTLCPEITQDARDFAPEYVAYNADGSPWLRSIRSEARLEAEKLYDFRRQQLFIGNFDEVVLDVDALGTAQKIAAVKDLYGIHSPEYIEVNEGMLLDCSRKIGEASRKNSWEYFKPTTQKYDSKTDQLYAHGLSVDVLIGNGISPVAEPEELALRFNDKVYHHTAKEIIKTPAIGSVATVRLSPCPEWAHASLKNNLKAAHGGYAPEIDKLMVNFDVFDSAAQEVHHEQFGVSGIYITPEVMQEVLTSINVVAERVPMSRTEIHGTVGVLPGEQISSVVEVVQLLDQTATRRSGKNIFLGEVVPDGHAKDYAIVYTESEERSKEQQALSGELAKYAEDLQAQSVDHAVATQMVEKFIQDKLLDVVEKDPTQAEVIFNKETAVRFEHAAELERQGNAQAAVSLRAEARIEAPATSSCGAGSCGLEGIDDLSTEAITLKKLLKAEDGDTVVKDKVRACKNCGEKSLVYAYTNKKVNTACTNCDAFNSKKSK